MDGAGGEERRLALLIHPDAAMRRRIRRMLAERGLELIHATSGIAGLELLQHLDGEFALVLVDLELRGLSGELVVHTLRLLRPELPVVCLSRSASAARMPNGPCLPSDAREDDFDADLPAALAGMPAAWERWAAPLPTGVAARVRARYRETGDLVEAAYELARCTANGDADS
ncbi:MAG TPA: response regulator [Gemmatimonadales bacterium]|jgi:CheY-like chemotaxis protein|nr:response regulator [Gemmatimonadales bacterium]